MMEAAFIQLVCDDPDISALLGENIHAQWLPQDADYPALSYLRMDTKRGLHHDGPSGLNRARMQIDLWGESHMELRQIADVIIKRLHGFEGMIDSVDFNLINAISDRDFPAQTEGLKRISLDFYVNYNDYE